MSKLRQLKLLMVAVLLSLGVILNGCGGNDVQQEQQDVVEEQQDVQEEQQDVKEAQQEEGQQPGGSASEGGEPGGSASEVGEPGEPGEQENR